MCGIFDNIDYLRKGNERQQQAYALLTRYDILGKLKAYDALLAGTIPIAIDIKGSDLDIICQWTDKEDFIFRLETLFADEKNFRIGEELANNSVLASFELDDWAIEIFGQNIPVKQQNAYRHMLAEHRLLMKYGDDFRQKIIELKKQGYKTEPAFAHALGLKGDPYEELLRI